ncbi:aspartate-alanine antiporter [Bradyrhizobium sp. UFLA05-112]
MQIFQTLVDTLRQNPVIALFLTLAIGFWFGNLKFGTFSLGAVTSTLIAGLLIGQLHIHIDPAVQDTFFMMFLFAVGYSVGPVFIRALKTDGLPQVAFTLIVCCTGLGAAYVAARLLGYDPAVAAGLLAGSYTNSGTLGVATANMGELGLDPQQTASMASLVAIAYAVTYPFGAVGSAWFLATLGPRLLGIDLVHECKRYEAKMGTHGTEPGVESAWRPLTTRSYRLENDDLAGQSPRDLNGAFDGAVITRYRQGNKILEPDTHAPVEKGATLAISGPQRALLSAERIVGPEVEDPELLTYVVEEMDVVVTRKAAANRTVRELEQDEFVRFGRSIFLLRVTRAGQAIEPSPDLVIQRRDVLTLRGARKFVEDLATSLGYADRRSSRSDIAFMGAGIVIGSLVGLITVNVAGIPLSLSAFVGTLIAGLVFGYLRSVYRTFGAIPAPALWVFNNVGLSGFLAVVGLNAGPGLTSGLATYGISLFVAGIFASLAPLIVALVLGKYLFRFHPAILLGACAGARSATPALGAIQEAAKSTIPAIGYTIPYAVSRIVLAIFGVVILLVMK